MTIERDGDGDNHSCRGLIEGEVIDIKMSRKHVHTYIHRRRRAHALRQIPLTRQNRKPSLPDSPLCSLSLSVSPSEAEVSIHPSPSPLFSYSLKENQSREKSQKNTTALSTHRTHHKLSRSKQREMKKEHTEK